MLSGKVCAWISRYREFESGEGSLDGFLATVLLGGVDINLIPTLCTVNIYS